MDRRRWFAGAVAALAVVGAGAGLAVASAGDDRPLEGPALRRATEAALRHTGGGTVLETEVGDEGAAYDVGVRLGDGTIVEVALDERFRVIGEETDDGGARGEQRDGAGDD